ncbi:MAG TPA: bifunctional serine/threonine-protein kinase/formylglycine-generating enzyme family protein [Planctomycetota bacterium]
MPERPIDEAFVRQLLKVGLVTDQQLEDARLARAKRHTPVPLAQVLVERGVLTHSQRENIERKLENRRDEAKRLGPYRLLKKLGEGGMGAVYLAEGPLTSKARVALKVLPKSAAKEVDSLQRFLREVDSARRLDHPNIVRASGGGEDRGYHYYAMEFVEGETLGDRLRRQDVFPPDEATRVVLQIARGLAYAHAQGVIHRDIKPDNIILSLDGVAKILDMGLSKNMEGDLAYRTTTGVMVGTPHYIAPEQARADQDIDGRADIYGLGATYYHLVTGETPYQGSTAVEVIAQHLNKQLPDPRDVRDGIPDGVVHVLRRMMAKEREDRYADGRALIADLEVVLQGRVPDSQALEASRSTVAQPLPKEARERFRAVRRRRRPLQPSSRRPLWIAGAVAGLVLLLVGMSWRPAPPPRVEPKPPEVAADNTLKLDLGGGVSMQFIEVKPGSYLRGSDQPPGKEPWEVDARPPHPVKISRSFHLGKTEVTRRQFAAFVQDKGYRTEAEVLGSAWGRRPDGSWEDIPGNTWRSPAGFEPSEDDPVVCVTWIDATRFCAWLSEKTKREARLPYEAEWEYACRAETRGPWASGDTEASLGEYAWTLHNASSRTQRVGGKKPNAWGFHDMHGNVWEWCYDWSALYPRGEVVDPRGPNEGERRVMRGGAWYLEPVLCRSSTRALFGPSNRYTSVGFRVALP